MAVEASDASSGYGHGEYVRVLLAEIMCEDFAVRRRSQFIRQWELVLVIDAKAAFDTLPTEGLPQDRRTALDFLKLCWILPRRRVTKFLKISWFPTPTSGVFVKIRIGKPKESAKG